MTLHRAAHLFGILTALIPAVLLALSPPSAQAADWITLQGTEAGQDGATLRPSAFFQLLGEAYLAQPVTGMDDPALEDRYASFNVVKGPDVTSSMRVHRARVGIRGTIPGSEGRVVYALSAELGMLGLTADHRVVPVDASVSLIPARAPKLRLGQFKLPLSDETLEALQVTGDWIDWTLPVNRFLLERGRVDGIPKGAVYGNRDIGAMTFDSYALGGEEGPFEVSWALALTNGRMGWVDDNRGKDVSGRVQLARLLDGRRLHPDRSEVALYAWGLRGTRPQGGEDVERVRAGAGIHYRQGRGRARVEGYLASGMLQTDPATPLAGEAPRILPEGEGLGLTTLFGVTLGEVWELDGGYNLLREATGSEADGRMAHEGMVGLQYAIAPRAVARLNLRYQRWAAPGASEDVQGIYASAAPKLALQLTARF